MQYLKVKEKAFQKQKGTMKVWLPGLEWASPKMEAVISQGRSIKQFC